MITPPSEVPNFIPEQLDFSLDFNNHFNNNGGDHSIVTIRKPYFRTARYVKVRESTEAYKMNQ